MGRPLLLLLVMTQARCKPGSQAAQPDGWSCSGHQGCRMEVTIVRRSFTRQMDRGACCCSGVITAPTERGAFFLCGWRMGRCSWWLAHQQARTQMSCLPAASPGWAAPGLPADCHI